MFSIFTRRAHLHSILTYSARKILAAKTVYPRSSGLLAEQKRTLFFVYSDYICYTLYLCTFFVAFKTINCNKEANLHGSMRAFFLHSALEWA